MCWIHDFALTDQLQFGNKVLTSWRLLKITPLTMNWQLTVATKLVKWKWFESVFRVSQESQRILKEPQRIPTKLKTVAMERKSQRKDRSGSHGNLSENLQTNRKSFRNPMRILKRNSVNLPRILENLKRIANWVWTRKNEGQILLNRILLWNCHNKSFFFSRQLNCVVVQLLNFTSVSVPALRLRESYQQFLFFLFVVVYIYRNVSNWMPNEAFFFFGNSKK